MQPGSQLVLVSVDLPRPGDELGNYVIERQLGQGGMAVVYEARHRVLGKRVALKMLLPHHACGELAQRFHREGEAAARLEHPNAVSVLDAGSDARGTPYLVLEYLEGEDLCAVLLREKRLSVTHTVDLLLPMIAAIAAAHDLGIVHRDLKPENLFLARRHGSLVPKVLDFGISKTAEAESLRLTRSESLLGTPHYMSPEQAQGAGEADARTDQFAIGVMLYECVTGQRPFEGNSLFAVLAAIVAGTLTPPSALVEGLDPAFEAIVMRTLSKEPEARFPDLRTLGAELLPLASARVRLNYAPELATPDAVEAGASERSDTEARAGADERNEEEVRAGAGERSDTEARAGERHDDEAPHPGVIVVPASAVAGAADATEASPVLLADAPASEASPTLPPDAPSAVRTPVLVGSAVVLATLASFGAAALDDDARTPVTGEPTPSVPTRAPSPIPAAAALPSGSPQAPSCAPPRATTNSSGDEHLKGPIEERRKPSGLRFEAIDAPSLCVTPEHED